MSSQLTVKNVEEGRSESAADAAEMDPMFRSMIGRKIASIEIRGGKTQIVFKFSDGHVRTFDVKGGCCSQSWIEHLEFPTNIITVVGGTVIRVRDSAPITQNHNDHDHQYRGHRKQVYNTVVSTDLGDIVIEYRNSSNGFYGGSLSTPDEIDSNDDD